MNKIVHDIGLDVHKETIAVSIAPQGSTEVRCYGIIGGTLDAVDKLIKRLSQPDVELRLVYEAGPCGFVLCRHLRSKGLHCDLVCPSLIPKKASDRVKTDRRDADQLARLYRAGELTFIHVPDQEDEAIRDLIRARTAAVHDQRQVRHRLKGFLLRQGFRYTGRSSWNDAHIRTGSWRINGSACGTGQWIRISSLASPRGRSQHAGFPCSERGRQPGQFRPDHQRGWQLHFRSGCHT